MRVLVVSNMYPSAEHPAYGGFVHKQVESLRRSGVEVDLAVITDRRKGLKNNVKKYLRLLLGMSKMLRKRYSACHAHYFFPTGLIALPFAVLTGTPLVLTAHGGDVRLGRNKKFRPLAKLVLNRAKAVIAVSETLAAEIRENFGTDPSKVMVASCGVDTALFYPRDRGQSREALGISAAEKVVLFVGNFVPVKGLSFLLPAFAEAVQSEPQARLVLLGEGPLRAELQELAAGLGIAERCLWLPPMEHAHVPEVMAAADLLVLPSLHEGFGLVALESLACGVPVVASRAGGVPEIVADGDCGLLVEPGDIEGLSSAMSELMADDARREQFGRRGRELAERHAESLQLDKILAVYDKVRGRSLADSKEMKRYDILGVPADALTYQTAVERVRQSVVERSPLWILAINPEKVMKARADLDLRRLLLRAGLFIPDGIGILWAGKLLGTPFPERVTGADLLSALVAEAGVRGWKIYLLGASPGVAKEAAEIWQRRHPELKVAGIRDGYFSEAEEEAVVAEIAAAAPDLLFVAMGSPRQEKFIDKYGERLGAPVRMGVGGSFDVVSGRTKRAPVWMQKTGLEWSYRLIREPRRILRMAALPRFMLLVLRKKLGLLKLE